MNSQSSLVSEFIIPWGKAYDSVCSLFTASTDGWQKSGDLTQNREKCDRFIQIQCFGCDRTFRFSQLIDIGALTIFNGVVSVSTGPVDSALVKLSGKTPNTWICPYCSSESIVFRLLGKNAEAKYLLRFKQILSEYAKTD